MNTFDLANTSHEDALKLIAKVAALLGVEEAHDHDAIEAALHALFEAAGDRGNSNDADGANELTESERKACRAQGCSFRDFLRLKKSTSVEAQQARLHRARTAVAGIKTR